MKPYATIYKVLLSLFLTSAVFNGFCDETASDVVKREIAAAKERLSRGDDQGKTATPTRFQDPVVKFRPTELVDKDALPEGIMWGESNDEWRVGIVSIKEVIENKIRHLHLKLAIQNDSANSRFYLSDFVASPFDVILVSENGASRFLGGQLIDKKKFWMRRVAAVMPPQAVAIFDFKFPETIWKDFDPNPLLYARASIPRGLSQNSAEVFSPNIDLFNYIKGSPEAKTTLNGDKPSDSGIEANVLANRSPAISIRSGVLNHTKQGVLVENTVPSPAVAGHSGSLVWVLVLIALFAVAVIIMARGLIRR